ncbi:MAG TPA: SRPBCC domain-containing protein [Flavisolibacter sp.]
MSTETTSNAPVIKEVVLDAGPERVWKAITDRNDMKQWYFDLEEFRAEPGFEFRFYGGTEEHQYLHICRITEVIPLKKLSYSWRYDGYPGESFVTFELFPEGSKTRLRLTHEGLETFPAENSDFAKTNFIAGWEDIIGSLLPKYLQEHQ